MSCKFNIYRRVTVSDPMRNMLTRAGTAVSVGRSRSASRSWTSFPKAAVPHRAALY